MNHQNDCTSEYRENGCKHEIPQDKWDYLGDMAIQICLMLDKTLPNKYSSSFLETLEIKIKDILEPKIRQLLSETKAQERSEIVEKLKHIPMYYHDEAVSKPLFNCYSVNDVLDLLTSK